MEKPFTALEMTSSAVKLIVGYELDGRAIVLDTLTMPLADVVINGQLTNPGVAAHAILKLTEQVKSDLGFQVTDVVIALPPIGLKSIFKTSSRWFATNSWARIKKSSASSLTSSCSTKAARSATRRLATPAIR
ncbi:MAG: hypothetical protein NTV44_00320 [Firmicutes bacterium]|nr:hypothetical protein [Bacillota bacterium]